MKRLLSQGEALPWLVLVCVSAAVATPADAQTLPAPWLTRDIGSPAIAGSASVSSGTFTVKGAGADIWGTADQFRFVYQPLQGDIDVRARVTSLQMQDAWSKAGVMIRADLTASSPHANMLVTPVNGYGFQRRVTAGGTSSYTAGPVGTAPGWVRLVRTGNLFTAYYSADGSTWKSVGSQSITMPSTVYVGLAVTSHNVSAASTATFTNVSAGRPALPAPWTHQDVGAPAIAGRASASSGVFSVTAAGADIWGTSDQFHFVYQPVQGNTEILARVASFQGPDAWSKAGIMIRSSLTGSSQNVFIAATVANGWMFQRRLSAGASSLSDQPRQPGTAPGWLRLVREGSLFSGYYSPDGSSWILLGSDTIAMGSTVYVGLAVTSHNTGQTATATYSNVTVRAPTSSNQAPTVSISSPSNGATFTAPASIGITAAASDSDGTVSRVAFYANGTLIGSDTSNPFSTTWSSVPAGSYSLTAVATDNGGATKTSPAVSVTVSGSTNQLPNVLLTSPANGSTFTAPANITLTASASDSDGTVNKVDFYRGTTLIGSDTSSPYSVTWSSAPAGSYSLTAMATDNSGARRTSASVSITVTTSTTATLPAPWLNRDIGSPALSGQASLVNSVFTVTGAGTDIWNAADQFHFVYQPVQGDIEIVARVASFQAPHAWSKAGVMIRGDLTAGARNAFMLVSGGSGYAFQRRTTAGGSSVVTYGPAGTAPGWVRLVRAGSLFTAYYSATGSSWTTIGSATISMASTVYVGLAVTSHDAGTRATATFSNVNVRVPNSTNQLPSVSITAPANGATFVAPGTVGIAASASDPDGSIARVDFYAGTTLIGTDSGGPYTATWSNVPAGTYSLTAIARDNAGASRTSGAVTIAVGSSTTITTTTLVFTPSVDHATLVTSYSVALRRSTDAVTATPVATRNIGKPAIVNNEISVDISTLVNPLPSGSYYAVVTAIGSGGSSASSPSPTFTK